MSTNIGRVTHQFPPVASLGGESTPHDASTLRDAATLRDNRARMVPATTTTCPECPSITPVYTSILAHLQQSRHWKLWCTRLPKPQHLSLNAQDTWRMTQLSGNFQYSRAACKSQTCNAGTKPRSPSVPVTFQERTASGSHLTSWRGPLFMKSRVQEHRRFKQGRSCIVVRCHASSTKGLLPRLDHGGPHGHLTSVCEEKMHPLW